MPSDLQKRKPTELDNPDVDSVADILRQYIDFVAEDNYHEDNDWHWWIRERVLVAYYGPDVFKWIDDVGDEIFAEAQKG